MNNRTPHLRFLALAPVSFILLLSLPFDSRGVPAVLPDPDGSTGSTNKPVKVFILSGQSNMVGFGRRDGSEPGTLEYITSQLNMFPNLVDGGGGWTVRNDVLYRGVISAVGNGPLYPQFGANTSSFGPELGFGHVVGWYLDEPVILLKTSIGNRSIGWDCLPPGSAQYDYNGNTYAGYGDAPGLWPTNGGPSPTVWYAGKQYDDYFLDEGDMGPNQTWTDATAYPNGCQLRHNGTLYISSQAHTSDPTSEPGIGAQWATYWNVYSVFSATDILDNFATEYPQYAAQGFEIAGFAWWQGHKDQGEPYASRYETNLVNFINELRSYYTNRYPGQIAADAPFVLATIAFGGWGLSGAGLTVANGQLAVSGETGNYPAFKDNVKTVEARGFWRNFGPSGQDFHYYHNAETYMLAGDALGRTMVAMLGGTNEPPNPNPMDFTMAPAPVDGTTITMTAFTAYDITSVEYFFTNTVNGSTLGWGTNLVWTDTGLTEGITYGYQVKARDAEGNETAWSPVANALATNDIIAPIPNPMTFGVAPIAQGSGNAVDMTATTAVDEYGSDPVEYYFENTNTLNNSGWITGTNWTDNGVTEGVTYGYRVQARDALTNTTAWSAVAFVAVTKSTNPPVLWLDASDPATITESGGLVSQWNDISGNDRHVTQGTSSKRPTYLPTGFNNGTMPCLEFLEGDGGHAGKALVHNLGASLPAGEWALFVVLDDQSNDNENWLTAIPAGGFDEHRWKLGMQGPEVRSDSNNGGSSGAAAFVAGEQQLYFGLSGTSSEVRRDGTQVAGNNGTYNDRPGVTRISVGARGATGHAGINGKVAEFILLDYVPSAGERQDIECYLANKWGLADQLPSDHPCRVIQKSASEETLNLDLPPTNLVYTIDVLNTFTSALGGIVVTDALPAEVSFVSSTPPADQTNGNEHVFNIGTLGAGASFQITIDVLVTSTVPSIITNTASFVTTNTNVFATAILDTAETLLYRPTDLAIAKTASVVQTNISYTLSVTNLSSVPADNVVVTDTLPSGAVYDNSTPLPDGISGRDYSWNLGTLGAGGGSSISLSLVYTSSLPATVTNTAFVTTTTLEDAVINNTAVLVSLVGQGVDLALVKTVNPTNLNLLGGASNLTYTLAVNNIGTTSAVSVVVTDSLPVEILFVSSIPSPVQTNGNTYTFDLGAIAAGSGTSIVIDVVYTAGVFGVTLTNWAVVYTSTQEISQANNTDTAETVIVDPGLDTDGDGMTDLDEIIAGTRPLDPTSYLWVHIDRTSNNTIRTLAFPSVVTRTYHIQSSTNFVSGSWVDVQTNIPGINALINTFKTSVLEKVYYRIGVESP